MVPSTEPGLTRDNILPVLEDQVLNCFGSMRLHILDLRVRLHRFDDSVDSFGLSS